MAKSSGLGDAFYYNGNDLSGDVNSISKLSTPLATIDSTDITQLANARLGGLRAAELDWAAFFDPSLGHPVWSALPLTDQIMSYFRTTAVGAPAFTMQGLQLNYDLTRGADASLSVALTAQSDKFGGEWGIQLTPGKRVDTGAFSGAGYDDTANIANGVSTQFGGQAYLHVFAVSGGSPDIVVQHAPDNTTWTTLTDFGAQGAAPAVVRNSFAGTVQRYLRVITTGAFTSVTLAVQICRNPIAVNF